MKLLEVVCARYDADEHVMHLVKEVEMPDGSTHLNLTMFKPETLAARAAEYGTDDVDELIDIIVHGPHIEPVEHLNMSAAEALSAHRERMAVSKSSLAKTGSTKVVRADKLSKAGVAREYVDAVEEDYVEVIKRHCTPQPEHVQHFKKAVEAERERRKAPKVDKEQPTTKMGARLKVLADQEKLRQMRKPKAPAPSTHVKIVLNKGRIKKS